MKPHLIERDIKTFGVVTSQKMGIAEGAEHLVMTALRRDIYSDPITGIFREYMANAYDEHVRLNIPNKPFEVTFPTALIPQLKIRDFGRGLDRKQTLYFFGKFGASDKRDTNELVGCFGFGNKIGHAYTDSFTVTSFLNGVKRVFNAYIGQDEIGDIVQLGEDAKTDEPNGVEISIPVLTKDISSFIDKGIKVAKYFPTKPIIKGLSTVPNLGNDKPIMSGNGWRYFAGSYQDKAVMMIGPIAYPIDTNALGYWTLQDWQRNLLNANLHIDVGIGEVDIVSSREALRFTDRTKNHIISRLETIKTEIVSEAEKSIKNATTLFEAKKIYNEVFSHGGVAGIVSSACPKVFWNGVEIKDNIIRFDGKGQLAKHEVIAYSVRRRRRTLIDVKTDNKLYCATGLDLYFDDTDGKVVNYKRRAQTLFDENETARQANQKIERLDTFYLVKTTDKKEFEKLTGLEAKSLKSYNAVTPTFISRAGFGTGADAKKRAKHQTKVFEFDFKDKIGRTYASDFWTAKNIDVDNTDGFYIEIDRFQPVKSKVKSNDDIKKLKSALETYGIKIDKPIFGFKAGVKTGKLVHFDTWFLKAINGIKGLVEDEALANEYNPYQWSHSKNVFDLSIPKTKLTGIALRYAELCERASKLRTDSNRDARRKLIEIGQKKVPTSSVIHKLSAELIQHFPLIDLIPSHRHNSPAVVEYLKSKVVP